VVVLRFTSAHIQRYLTVHLAVAVAVAVVVAVAAELWHYKLAGSPAPV